MSDKKEPIEAKIRQRFYGLMEIFTLEPAEFARRLGTSLQRIQDIKRNESAIPQDLLTAAVETFHVDGHWLLTGLGEQFKAQAPTPIDDGVRSAYERKMRFGAKELRGFSPEQLKILFPRGLDYDPGKGDYEDAKAGASGSDAAGLASD